MTPLDPRVLACMRCLLCRHSPLERGQEGLICRACQTSYAIKHAVPYLLDPRRKEEYNHYTEESKEPINKFKAWVKRNPRLFYFLNLAVGSTSFFGQSAKKTLRRCYGPAGIGEKIILNIGAGTHVIHPEVIHTDLFPFPGVSIVFDATTLPFADNTVDMIICESTLEHLSDARRAIEEIQRVVKPGGFVYVSIPFLLPFHASPNDYGRLTHKGLEREFHAFQPIKIGMQGGPASALVAFFMHFLAMPFSAISESAYHIAMYIFMIILSPLRIFDLLFYLFPNSIEAASVIYFIGQKK